MIPNPYPGIFFVFEGIDGCGKSTQVKLAQKHLVDAGYQAKMTKEPWREDPWGTRIYEDLFDSNGLHKRDPAIFQTWYACNSKSHLQEVVIPALKNGNIVVCDRFRLSMSYGAKDPSEIIGLMGMSQRIIGKHFIWPDTAFIFDLSPETAIERLKQKGRELDGHEAVSVLTRVRKNYRHFANNYPNCHMIDADKTVNEILDDVKKILDGVIAIKRGGQTPWALSR